MSSTYTVTVDIDVANQTITSSDPENVTVPTSNFDIVTFDGKSCIRANHGDGATFYFGENIESFSCKIFLQSVNDFTLFVGGDTNSTRYSLVYYPYGYWYNPDRATFDPNNDLVGTWVTVTYSNTDKTLTFDNGTTQFIRTIDDYLINFAIACYDNRYNVYLTDLEFEVPIPSSKYLNGTGLSEVWANIKNYVAAQLLGKQDTLISGTNIKTINNQSLLGSGNVSFTPPTFTYDSSTETLSVSNTTATVFNYDANSETLEIQVNG